MLQYLRAGTIKRIHVDRRIIAQNRESGRSKPAITVQTSKGSLKAISTNVLGHSEMRMAGSFRRDTGGTKFIKPLSCGARVWLETRAAVEVIT